MTKQVRLFLWVVFGMAVAGGAGAAFLHAQQSVTLATPIVKTATGCSVDAVILDLKGSRIVVNVSFNSGDVVSKQYDSTTTPTGATLLHNLNTANFAGAVSLINAVHNRLSADGICVGTITGTPQ